MNEVVNNTKQLITDALQTKCKGCGGIMEYSPADENLKCVYCGQKRGAHHASNRDKM